MLLRNYTPFPCLPFAGLDTRVLVVRGAFKITPIGRLRPDPTQPPIVASDTFHGAPGESSQYVESDLAPFKRRSDILVNAIAHAPSGLPARSWLVSVRVGPIEKQLRVTGPRRWSRDESGRFELTEPDLCMAVPLRYELAFGGTCRTASGQVAAFRENPVGTGYLPEGPPPGEVVVAAPQIEDPRDPIGPLGAPHAPQGLGPICRAWQPRLGLAGSFDDAWRRERWPELPLDFDLDFYNCAHPDLIHPSLLRGDETVLLTGMHPDGDLQFSLPGHHMAALFRFKDGTMAVVPLALDTLFIDVPSERVHLTWRVVYLLDKPIRVLEVRMNSRTNNHVGLE